MSAGLLALFVAFGVLIGVLFGFFGMGGSFLVTPALLVSLPALEQFARKHPALLFPAFHMQEVLRSKCLGPAFWTATTIRRHKGKDQTDEDVIALLQKMEVEAQEAEAKRGPRPPSATAEMSRQRDMSLSDVLSSGADDNPPTTLG